jgi:hypothetical protein
MMKSIHWKKSLLSSLIAWLFSFLFSAVIAIAYAFYLLSKYNLKSSNPGQIGKEIGLQVGLLFSDNFTVIIIVLIASALFIFWRAHVTAKKVNENNIFDGIVVSLFPILYSLSYGLDKMHLTADLVIIILYVSCGVLGSSWKLKTSLNNS